MQRILLVEDEEKLQVILCDYFKSKGEYELICASDGVSALEYFEVEEFNLIILDVMMPRLDGFSVCKEIRKRQDIPIIFLTAKVREEDQLYGYALGADDYIMKPFSLGVLYAKVTALLKRTRGTMLDECFRINGLCINYRRMEVTSDREPIQLAPMEYKLLVYLIAHKNQVVTRDQLIVRLWGYDYEGDERAIDTHIKKLRKALGKDGRAICTIRKVGYRFDEKEK